MRVDPVADPATPIIFLQAKKLFGATLRYALALQERLSLTDVRWVEPDEVALRFRDPEGRLYQRDPDACCRLRDRLALDDALTDRIRQQIRAHTTPRHVPAKVLQVAEIPRTTSGKIVELAVQNVVHGRAVKNIDALANPEALDFFKDRAELSS